MIIGTAERFNFFIYDFNLKSQMNLILPKKNSSFWFIVQNWEP